jgi:hypothetical protein
MTNIPVPGYQAFWTNARKTFESEFQRLTQQHPEAEEQIQQLLKILRDIEDVAGHTPKPVGESQKWTNIVSAMEENRASYCKSLSGKSLYSALYGSYTVTLNELRGLIKAKVRSQECGSINSTGPSSQEEEGFKMIRRRKRQNSQETAETAKRAATLPTANSGPKEVPTRNFFAPLRTTSMDTDSSSTENTPQETATTPTAAKTGRPPPIILTSTVNLIQLQKQLKNILKEDFEFRTTRNGTRIVTRVMVDFLGVKSHLENHKLSFFTFFPKSEKPIKAVIRHLPINTPAEDICDGLVSLGFDVVSVKQMTTTRRSTPEEPKVTNLPLFLITLPRSAKSQEIFRLPSLCHIAIKVEPYRNQSALTQCHNCQRFGHVWANCKQPPRCLWCGGGHLHKECPEKENVASTPTCCNCKLLEGETPHPANYRGCRHAREELQKRKSQKTPRTTTTRVFSSNTITPGVSFAAALRGSSAQTEQPREMQLPVATPHAERGSHPSPGRQQMSGQSVRAPSVNNQPTDTLTIVTTVQQIMTEFRGAVSEQDTLLAITKIVINLMNQNGH